MYSLDEIRKFKKDNSIEWQLAGWTLARQTLVEMILNGEIHSYKKVMEIEKEFEIPHEKWSSFGYLEKDYYGDENN